MVVEVSQSSDRSLRDTNTTTIFSGSVDHESLEEGAQHMRVMLALMLVGFVTMWLLCVGLIWHVRVNRAGAFKGDAQAAKRVILPAYEPVLYVMAILNGAYILFLVVMFAMDCFDAFVTAVTLESVYAAHQFMFVFVLMLLFEKSLSYPAVKRAVGISLILSYNSTIYVWTVTKLGQPRHQKQFTVGLYFVRGLLMVPFAYALVKPPSRASKRIIRELCLAAIASFLLAAVAVALSTNLKTAGVSHHVMYAIFLWMILEPLVVWRVLKADTRYWRGVGKRACALQDCFQRENCLSERLSSDGLHVLIEMNRKLVIDFAYLELVRQLGVGSKSTVFQGTLKMKSLVAVKAYAPTSCSEDVVAAFSHEAAMCSVLNHPNIVRFYGMCIAPPTICFVFQLCQGSLADLLASQVRRQNTHPARQQLLISVGYMLDAARAVAYLHSFSPPFVHRGIQPTSFLVDAACNVQLSDFGESRCLTKLNQHTRASNAAISILQDKQFSVLDSPMGTTVSSIDSPWSMHMKKNSTEFTAPEILEKTEVDVYGEAADVYSLAVTMWDILHPERKKYPQTNGNQLQVIEEVLHGARPDVKDTPLRLRSLIERAWHHDPGLRPSAKQVVASLEDLQEELCSSLALDLMGEVGDEKESNGPSLDKIHSFPGAALVDRMIDRRFVRCQAEAIRMGNALMDSRALHHVHHCKSFENSMTARYYFTFDEVHSNAPTYHLEKLLERSSSSSSFNGSSLPMLARHSYSRSSCSLIRSPSGPTCQCCQLGQRLISAKHSRFRRQKKFQAAPEPAVNILAAALLVEEEGPSQHYYNGLDTISGTAATMA